MSGYYKLVVSLEDFNGEDGKQHMFYAYMDKWKQIKLNSGCIRFPVNPDEYNYEEFVEGRKVHEVILKYYAGSKLFTWRKSKGMRISAPDARGTGEFCLMIHLTDDKKWTCYIEERVKL